MSIIRADFSLSFSISSFTSFADTFISTASTSTPLYLPSLISGFNATSAVKIKGFPNSICTISILG